MRSIVFFILCCVFASHTLFSQTNVADNPGKVRFGLRFNPQPSWFGSNDKNTTPSGAIFGYGFGLNIEYRLSEVASLLTGLGGDFEGGKIKYRLDPVNNFQVCYFKNEEDAFIQPKNNSAINELKKSGNTVYLLKDRKINSTFVSLPVILKLSTKDINGFKYFGLMGLEIGFRIKAKASDNFYEVRKYLSDTTFETLSNATIKDIDIGKDASLVPLRLGFNVGAGVEYRLAGSTSFFASVNYFNSLTNFMRSDSKYLMTNWQAIELAKGSTQMTYKMLGQNLILKAVRINIGFMF